MASEYGIDYGKLGFRCGLEIHQQIGSNKLFCRCPTINIEGPCSYQIKRRLRGVVGETGEIDIAAKFETEKGKYFLYEGHSENTCLIELDESPPNPISKEALETALKIALLLNARIVDEVQVMRKTVVDGSNVSGFQRTALIAMDGFIETSQGKINIPTICLEEEAAQKIGENSNFARYRLDRLGIPLIEIATDAGIKSAEHAKDVAAHIGMILRSVENIKRGLGTIRQDVNISIEKGARTEIKGFQDLKSIPKVIEYEVNRQIEAIKQSKKINKEVRKAEPDFTTSFLRPLPGAARLYPETDALPVRIDKDYIEELRKKLPKLLTEKVYDFEKKYELPKGMGKDLIGTGFEHLVERLRMEPLNIANIILNTPNEIKRKISAKDFEEVLSYYAQGKIAKEAIADLLEKKAAGQKIELDHLKHVSEEDLEKEIRKTIAEKPGLSASAYMGLIMAKYRGKVDGKKVMELLNNILKK